MKTPVSKEFYDNLNPLVFNGPLFQKRANQITKLLLKRPVKRIFEAASGGSVLAETILTTIPLELYVWTDFCPKFIASAEERLGKLKPTCAVQIREFDIDKQFQEINWDYHDTFICVSMEHLANDVELIKSIPAGKRILLSCPNLDAEDHLRVLKNIDDVKERYGEFLDVKEFIKFDIFTIVDGVRKAE